MPINKVDSVIVESAPSQRKMFDETCVIADSDFAIADNLDKLKQLRFSVGGLATDTIVTLTAPSASGTMVTTASTVVRNAEIPLETFRKGTNAPADVAIGTTPAVPGMLFAATNESAGLSIPLPSDYASGAVTLYLRCLLPTGAAETDADTLEFTGDYVAVRNSAADGAGGTVTKTSSATTGSTAVKTGGLAAGYLYEVALAFDPADASNPFTADTGHVIYCDVSRTTVGGAGKVGDAVLSGARLQYTAKASD